uniref:Uncharacterized protein n=1 Tax=Knipowitschia caucasica TaxID=637954 RepID=A0AAV2L4T6_KNICA
MKPVCCRCGLEVLIEVGPPVRDLNHTPFCSNPSTSPPSRHLPPPNPRSKSRGTERETQGDESPDRRRRSRSSRPDGDTL